MNNNCLCNLFDDNDGENDNPGAVVVEEVAKAVVIHMCFPPKAF